MSVVVDHDALGAIADALRDAGAQLDTSTAGSPANVDAGVASALLSSILHTVADTAAHLTYEAHHLGGLVDDCNGAYVAGDDSAARSLSGLTGEPR